MAPLRLSAPPWPLSSDPFDKLRLALMQQVLPVGIALAARARKGGPAEVAAVFAGETADPIDLLRQEGEPAASRLRARLDQVTPGLGNPVMDVEVREVDQTEALRQNREQNQGWIPESGEQQVELGLDPDPELLPDRLRQIGARLSELERRLQSGS